MVILLWWLVGLVSCILAIKYTLREHVTVGTLALSCILGIFGPIMLGGFVISWILDNESKVLW